jgi:hypothetical protein
LQFNEIAIPVVLPVAPERSDHLQAALGRYDLKRHRCPCVLTREV